MLCLKSFAPLIQWFQEVREDHFFRRNRTPYRVWIAEVALQQTRIQAALEPLRRFLKAFPTLADLARAEEAEVLKAFRGLGYYNRARNLLRGARYLVDQGGTFPQMVKDLLKVPSIGAYTSAAISSICFGQKEVAIDGNLRRIFARTEGLGLAVSSSELTKKSHEKLQNLFQKTSYHPGDLNEALMELGQKICLPKNPSCPSCPLKPWCKAQKTNKVDQCPGPRPKKEKIPVIWKACIFISSKKKVLLQKWEDFYFLKGHHSFPSSLFFPNTGKEIHSWEGLKNLSGILLPSCSHTITCHKIEIQPHLMKATQLRGKEPSSFLWVPEDQVLSMLVPSALQKIWKRVEEDRGG